MRNMQDASNANDSRCAFQCPYLSVTDLYPCGSSNDKGHTMQNVDQGKIASSLWQQKQFVTTKWIEEKAVSFAIRTRKRNICFHSAGCLLSIYLRSLYASLSEHLIHLSMHTFEFLKEKKMFFADSFRYLYATIISFVSCVCVSRAHLYVILHLLLNTMRHIWWGCSFSVSESIALTKSTFTQNHKQQNSDNLKIICSVCVCLCCICARIDFCIYESSYRNGWGSPLFGRMHSYVVRENFAQYHDDWRAKCTF